MVKGLNGCARPHPTTFAAYGHFSRLCHLGMELPQDRVDILVSKVDIIEDGHQMPWKMYAPAPASAARTASSPSARTPHHAMIYPLSGFDVPLVPPVRYCQSQNEDASSSYQGDFQHRQLHKAFLEERRHQLSPFPEPAEQHKSCKKDAEPTQYRFDYFHFYFLSCSNRSS